MDEQVKKQDEQVTKAKPLSLEAVKARFAPVWIVFKGKTRAEWGLLFHWKKDPKSGGAKLLNGQILAFGTYGKSWVAFANVVEPSEVEL